MRILATCAITAVVSLSVVGCGSSSSSDEDEATTNESTAEESATEEAALTSSYYGYDVASAIPRYATSVPHDGSDNALLNKCSNFNDDGKVDRTKLTPALYVGTPEWPYKWKCQLTSDGPTCCGTGIVDHTGWLSMGAGSCGNNKTLN